jgi:hypothetical protein
MQRKFDKIRDGPASETELEEFWLRKTKKPVLCVLAIQKQGGPVEYICGVGVNTSQDSAIRPHAAHH